MSTKILSRKTQKHFLDIATAAHQAGYSLRHFRKIIAEDHIPVLQIGRKCLIVAHEFEEWKATKGEARFEQTLQQLDRWIKQGDREILAPIDDMDDED